MRVGRNESRWKRERQQTVGMAARVLRAPPSFRDSDAPIASHLYLERTKRIEHAFHFSHYCLPIHSKTRYNKPSVTFGTDATTDATRRLISRLASRR